MILDVPDGLITDHINGNGLDNRKSNLRIANHSINNLNQHKLRDNKTSRYRGVSWNKRDERWVAALSINGRIKNLGSFKNEEIAVEVYNLALEKYRQIKILELKEESWV
jgi:hypothetical protein